MKQSGSPAGLCTLAALVAAGCGAQKHALLPPNQAPEVEIFAQRVDQSTTGPYTYRFQWTARDPDGRIERFLCSVGSPADDADASTWTETSARERTLSFPARASSDDEECGKTEPTVFSVRAVDAAGTKSAPARVAVFDGAIAPLVEIVSPRPSSLLSYDVGATLCIEWAGTAPDDGGGFSAEEVAQYKFKLLSDTTGVTSSVARTNPDSVRRYYAARDWAGWDSARGRVTSTVLRNLTAGREYVFVISCFDECGNYDPFFNFNKNMLYLRVTTAGPGAPTITVYNQYIHYTYSGAPYTPQLEIPAGQPITFNWSATPVPGTEMTGYRWALDLRCMDDEARRAEEDARSRCWSRWSITNTSATVGPFAGGETHLLHIAARNSMGCEDGPAGISLAVLRLTAIQPTFERELLVVDDTRLTLDRVAPGTSCDAPVNRPISRWPSAAELDTFLYARGGVPWRCYPAGTMSTPGIFTGYSFDTLGTRLGTNDLTIPLSRLSQYRHVIWLVDGTGAYNNESGTNLAFATTSMRYMNQIGRANTLAAYISHGGRVWLAGGGVATASLINFDKAINNTQQPMPFPTWSFANGELVPGRFIYDQAHWRSEMKQVRATVRIRRHLGRFESNPAIYQFLPLEMQAKTSATDPFPPNRVNFADFYQTQFDIEFLSAPNAILEDQDPSPAEDFQSTLDTLYRATGAVLPAVPPPGLQVWPVMTYYRGPTAGYSPAIPEAGVHGFDNPPLILTGFNIWSFRRSQCAELVDFVLQRLWGMTREGPGPAPAAVEAVRPVPVGKLTRPRDGAAAAAAPRGARGD